LPVNADSMARESLTEIWVSSCPWNSQIGRVARPCAASWNPCCWVAPALRQSPQIDAEIGTHAANFVGLRYAIS
jgi:hypothetical protein